jgi:hypothetical protein
VKPTVFLLFSLVPLLLAALILWLGAPMVVQCHRVAAPRAGTVPDLEANNAVVPQEEGRVDVTMHRRLLGVLRMRSDTAIDVVDGHSYVERDRSRRKRGGDTGTVLALELRDGRTWKSPGAYSPIGTPPDEMAARIKEFIKTPSAPPLRMWCMSWVCHLLATPLLLMGFFFAYAGLNVVRNNLREGRSANAPFTQPTRKKRSA